MKPEKLATIISVLGVILTTASVIASVAQYRAADLQAQAAVVALMPQIEVRALLEKVDSDKFTDRRIEITSDGGPVYNFQVARLTWIEFRFRGKTVLREALNGYYFASYSTSRTRGALHTIKGHKNNEIYSKFLDWSRSALPSEIEVSQPVTLLEISYRDTLKRDNLEFVQITGGTETHLSEAEGRRLWGEKPPTVLTPHVLDIDDLQTPERAARWVKAWSPILRKAVSAG